MNFDRARQIADAVLHEGYILYPYRASAQKNRLRWQFGVITPRSYSEQNGSDPWAMQTECLVEFVERSVLHLRLRFLQVQARQVEQTADLQGELFRPVEALEIDGMSYITWEEACEREIDFTAKLSGVLESEQTFTFEFGGKHENQLLYSAQGKIAGRIVRRSWPVSGRMIVGARRVGEFSRLAKIRIRIENDPVCREDWRERREALRQSLIGTHLLLGAEGGRFLSLVEPPEWAAEAAASCENIHLWPVLIGDNENRQLMLSAPIILYDYPEIAPESSGDFFDATEIDELLALRTMTLTEGEKREARATDARAANVVGRVDAMPAQALAGLHGIMRERSGAAKTAAENVWVRGVRIAPGSKVRLCPGARRADAQDMFLAGRLATVRRVLSDAENKIYLAVTLADDPAAELHEWYGRFHYFAPDEVEPLIEAASATRALDDKPSS